MTLNSDEGGLVRTEHGVLGLSEILLLRTKNRQDIQPEQSAELSRLQNSFGLTMWLPVT